MIEQEVEDIRNFLNANCSMKLNFIGVGNPIRRDDSVGLYIVSRLIKKVGRRPLPLVEIYSPVFASELALSRINCKTGKLIIFDAVEANIAAGSVIFTSIDDTKFGFFSTHNVPLRLLPTLQGNGSNVFVAGIQPEDVGIGEALSKRVKITANRVIKIVEDWMVKSTHGNV